MCPNELMLRIMNPLTGGRVVFVGKYNHKEGRCILGGVDQMRK